MQNTKTLATYAFVSFVIMFVFYFDSNMLASSKWDTLFYGLCEYHCLRYVDITIISATFLLGLLLMCLSWKPYKWKWGCILLLAFIVAIISYIVLSAVVAAINYMI